MADPSAFVARAREVLAKATPGPLTYDPNRPRTGFSLWSSNGHVADIMEVNGGLTREEARANAEMVILAFRDLAALCDVVETAVALRTFVTPDPYESTEGNEWNTTLSALDSAIARLEVPE